MSQEPVAQLIDVPSVLVMPGAITLSIDYKHKGSDEKVIKGTETATAENNQVFDEKHTSSSTSTVKKSMAIGLKADGTKLRFKASADASYDNVVTLGDSASYTNIRRY